MDRIIGIIPARSGSRGLKDKNIKILNGKPLLAYTIEAALNSEVFDEVVVSTDSSKYADIAKKYGAAVPFLRSDSLAGDSVSTHAVVVDVIERQKSVKKNFNYLMILQPTSPLRTSEDIQNSMNLLLEKKANAVVSLCETDHPPIFSGLVPDDLRIDGFIKERISFRRQDQQKYYRINGAIYVASTEYYIKNLNLFSKDCYAYIMDKKNSVDIDDEIDFLLAETIIKKKLNSKEN